MPIREWKAPMDMGRPLRYFGQDADVYHVKSMEDAMVEVEEGRADYAVLPIENSSAGAVSDNYDLLVKHNVYIVGETELAGKSCPFRTCQEQLWRTSVRYIPILRH